MTLEYRNSISFKKLRPMNYISFLMMTLLFCSQPLFGQERILLDDYHEQLLDSLSNAYLRESKMPGIAVGVIGAGKVMYAKGFGVKNLKTKEPITTQSIFHMASVSKTFVATAIAQMISVNKIQLDDYLVKHLPYFKLKDPRYKDITIRHMLTHSSGIPDVKNYHWNRPQNDDEALERYVRNLKNKKLRFTPGEKYEYSNTAFNILGDVIAKISGMSFESYMDTHILEPIGMNNSTFIKSEASPEFTTSPHIKFPLIGIKVSKVYPYNRIHAPSSTLNSNVEDMLKYGISYLNKGTINDQVIFDETAYNLLTSRQRKASHGMDLALSWFVDNPTTKPEDQGRISHSGEDRGYQCWLILHPNKSWGIVIFHNGDWKTPTFRTLYKSAYEIASKYE